MKKQILIIAVLTFAITLSACGGQAPQTATAPAVPTETVSQPTEAPAATETVVPATEAATNTDVQPPAGVSFVNDIKPIFDARCIKCHGVEQTKEGLDLQTYENIFAGSRNGPVIEPGNAADSLLVQLIVDGEMPNRGAPVTPEELQLIIDWVNQGALNN
ncbi:MAG: hypothetical protein JNM02_07015 [Anaerolineales bacterium]|nr:hypothetical protein [Anaerolineales bacterium]